MRTPLVAGSTLASRSPSGRTPLTTAKYYTPSHKVIHEEGITPDILVAMTDEEERDIQLQRVPGGLESIPEKDRDRVAHARDPQLDRAMDLLKGITLFTQRSPVEDKRIAQGEQKTAAK